MEVCDFLTKFSGEKSINLSIILKTFSASIKGLIHISVFILFVAIVNYNDLVKLNTIYLLPIFNPLQGFQ